MLRKNQRLTRPAFNEAFKNGKRHHGKYLQLINASPAEPFHGAVVVGKKVHKRAVDRNRLRRRIYGILYRHHQSHPLQGTYIFVTKPAIKEIPRQQIKSEVEMLLKAVDKKGS